MNAKKLGAMAISIGAIGALAAPIAAGAQAKSAGGKTTVKVQDGETCIDGYGQYGTMSGNLCLSNQTLLFSLLAGGLG